MSVLLKASQFFFVTYKIYITALNENNIILFRCTYKIKEIYKEKHSFNNNNI